MGQFRCILSSCCIADADAATAAAAAVIRRRSNCIVCLDPSLEGCAENESGKKGTFYFVWQRRRFAFVSICELFSLNPPKKSLKFHLIGQSLQQLRAVEI